MKELVSVIMSTYNESIDMLEASIQSILSQTYNNIQFIIINDNPNRIEMHEYLKNVSKTNLDKVKYIKNEKNMGLVKSLNIGIAKADGYYIARMDADDIAIPNRIEKQLEFLNNNNCDIVGASVKTIDDDNNIIGRIKVPVEDVFIKRFYDYGTCLLHPTWLAKKEVFIQLKGYREIFACEDYDFIVRAIKNGYRLGNVPDYLLLYRVRKNGISVSSETQQKLMMYFIIKNKKKIEDITISDFNNYINSTKYQFNYKQINNYITVKNEIKQNNNKFYIIKRLLTLVFNKYLYINIYFKIKNKFRNKYTFPE